MDDARNQTRPYIIAWAFGLIFYFLAYGLRSAPAVMIPELSEIFDLPAIGVSGIIGTYYYTYAITSLIAGIALDRTGAKYAVPAGLATLGIGCLIFTVPDSATGTIGRLLQGAGSATAFTGCVYLATRGFSPKVLATAIGFTQCLGMLGGSAGQFAVGPLVHSVLSVPEVWKYSGLASLIIGVALYVVTPKEKKPTKAIERKSGLLEPYKIVFTNPQSWLCGIVSGCLFAPTTIFIMTWSIAFFQQDLQQSYEWATVISSMVPLGWVIGCPLLGWFADRLGRRKPVLIAGCLIMIISLGQWLFAPGILPPYIPMLVFGIGSGAAMIPYTIIKETNPDHVKGSATGAINFLTFGVTTLIGPIFTNVYGKSLANTPDRTEHFRESGLFWMVVIMIAIVIGLLFLKETGSAVKSKDSKLNVA
jgi:MFS family permease